MLISYGLDTFSEDESLTSALSNPNLKSFRKSELTELFSSQDYKVLSWIPTAIIDPYSNNYLLIFFFINLFLFFSFNLFLL